MHGHEEKPFLCSYDGCERGVKGNGFPRHWNLRHHLKRVHNDSGHRKSPDALALNHDIGPVYEMKKAKGRVRRRDATESSANEIPRGSSYLFDLDLTSKTSFPNETEVPFTYSGYASLPKFNLPTKIAPALNKSQDAVKTGMAAAAADPDREDVKTVYSAATTVGPLHAQQYITELCRDIYSKIGECFDGSTCVTLSQTLPGLIKAFAFRIGYDSSATANQEIMYFIHRRHR